MAEAPAHQCQEAAVVAEVGAAGLPAVAVGLGALRRLGEAGPVGALLAGLPARRKRWAVEAEAAGLLLPQPALLQVGDLSRTNTQNGEGESQLLGWGGLTATSPLTHAH